MNIFPVFIAPCRTDRLAAFRRAAGGALDEKEAA